MKITQRRLLKWERGARKRNAVRVRVRVEVRVKARFGSRLG